MTAQDPTRDGPVVAERPAPGEPRPYEFPATTSTSLGNGLTVLLANLPGRPLVSAGVILPGGAAEEAPQLAGATVLAARALTEGTDHFDAVALTEATERLGAPLHAGAGGDALSVVLDVPAAGFEPALELLAEVLLHPTFPAEEVDRLRDERLNDLLPAQADPRRRAAGACRETFSVPPSPSPGLAGGVRETVSRLDADALRAAYE